MCPLLAYWDCVCVHARTLHDIIHRFVSTLFWTRFIKTIRNNDETIRQFWRHQQRICKLEFIRISCNCPFLEWQIEDTRQFRDKHPSRCFLFAVLNISSVIFVRRVLIAFCGPIVINVYSKQLIAHQIEYNHICVHKYRTAKHISLFHLHIKVKLFGVHNSFRNIK